jgi:MFS family permease
MTSQRLHGSTTGLTRLSILTFFLYFGCGAVVPIMGLYFTQYLHFSSGLAGGIISASALGVVAAPLVGSIVADRIISAERLLSLCLIGSALLIFLLSKAHSPLAVTILFAGHSLIFGPVMSLNNAVIFHHIENRGGDYGRIRVYGTLGWIAVAWLFSWFWLRGGEGRVLPERLPDALVLSAVVYAAMGAFSFFLPGPTDFRRGDRPELIPRDAFAVIFEREILTLVITVFLCFLTDRFFYYGAAIFLKQSAFDESRILPILSLGQILEIPAMAFLGRFLSTLGIKRVLLLGLV